MNNYNKNKTSPRAVSATLRRNQALRLRLQGHTYTQIGEIMGIDRANAHKYVKDALQLAQQEQGDLAAEVRQLTKDRLDALLASWWEKALKGDEKAAELALKLIDRQAKLFGLDAPVKSVTGHVDLIELSTEELQAQARAMGVDISDLKGTEANSETVDLDTIYEQEGEDTRRDE